MGLWNFLVTSQMDPEDDFRQRLRKSVIGILFFPCFFLLVGYAIRGFFTYTVPSHIAAGVSVAVLAIVFFVSYFRMRATRHVSDIHMTLTMWFFTGLTTIVYLAFPEFDSKSIIIMCASLAIMTQMLTLPVYGVFLILQMLHNDWNKSVLANSPERLWTFPDPRIYTSSTVVFIGYLCGTIVLISCIYMFYLQIIESERRGAAQTAANEMTMHVVQRHRKYDTEAVSKILEQCAADKVVDPVLIELFQGMNDNLESYRPFLPNYLFNDNEDADTEKADGLAGIINGPDDDDVSEGCIVMDEETDGVSAGASSMAAKKADRYTGRGHKTRPVGRGSIAVGDTASHTSRQSGASSGAASSRAGRSAPATLNKRGNIFVGRLTFALVDICVHRLIPNFASKVEVGLEAHHSAETLTSVVKMIYSLAKETKASVHSMLGDTVQLTWNATSNVVLPETKGAVFLSRLAKSFNQAIRSPSLSLAATSPSLSPAAPHLSVSNLSSSGTLALPMSITAAVCSGKATVHNVTANHQQALIIEAPWLPALEGCFDLAKQHVTNSLSTGGVILMDERTMRGSQMEIESCPVEQITYRPAHAAADETLTPVNSTEVASDVAQKFAFLGHVPVTKNSPQDQQESLALTSIVYQVLGEKVRADDEWMYQLQQDKDNAAGDNKNSNTTSQLQLRAINAMSEGRFGDAIPLLESCADHHASAGLISPSAGGSATKSDSNKNSSSSSPHYTNALQQRCQAQILKKV